MRNCHCLNIKPAPWPWTVKDACRCSVSYLSLYTHFTASTGSSEMLKYWVIFPHDFFIGDFPSLMRYLKENIWLNERICSTNINIVILGDKSFIWSTFTYYLQIVKIKVK